MELTAGEQRYCDAIEAKLDALGKHLRAGELARPCDAEQWLRHLGGIKTALGNFSNDISFVASLLIKDFLAAEYGALDFDAGGKPQGASGFDVEATARDGSIIVGELKTTTPYQPGFGAAQRKTILKDLERLANSAADHRLMFVVDADAFDIISGHKSFSHHAPGVRVIDLVTRRTHTCSNR